MDFEQLLGVNSTASKDELKKAYLQRLKELNENDSNFDNKLDRLSQAYKYLTRKLDLEVKPITLNSLFNKNLFRTPFMRNNFDTFNTSNTSNTFNTLNTSNTFNTSNTLNTFNTSNTSNIPNASNTFNTSNTPLSYFKYNTNFTSYDNNGVKQSKSASRIEKIIDNNRYVSQVTRTQDGNKIIEEKLNPDGTVTRTEKTLNKSLTD
jgi:DnaJ-class molecular chaperone